MPANIPTSRHLEYAQGYLGLGLVNEAADELELIEGKDRMSTPVLLMRCELYMAAKQWDMVDAMAKVVTAREPKIEEAWLHWAYALRRLKGLNEAKAILLAAEAHHAASATLHFNLGCYLSLLGDQVEARRRVGIACKMDKSLQKAALDDPDLKGMWDMV